ncbi:hypothetical protein C8J57DRAFT_1713062 [Mycena rebaudengoi]|nr:hypothetical protein C8J57DRAFT_1713062 [Mycena rebaudengoi]
MGKRKKGHSHYDAPPQSGPSTSTSVRGQAIRESTHVSKTGELRHSAKMVDVPASPSKARSTLGAMRTESQTAATSGNGEPVYDLFTVDEEEMSGEKEGGRDLRDSDDPLRQWLEDHRDSFAAEFLRWEGRGDHRSGDCPRNCGGVAEYRCRTCFAGGELLCRGCLLHEHQRLPFHQVEQWDGSFFHHKTLKDVGVKVQLGHWGLHQHCDSPKPAPGFVVVHEHGVEEVAVNFCGCGGGPPTVQLLRAGLYPATTTNPRSAATFGVLRQFHLMSFESKCSAYEFYHSLARESDNTGLRPPACEYKATVSAQVLIIFLQDRYHEFLRMVREWRHLQMLKRAGRIHDPEGILSTEPGECALLCPACPHPGKNIPDDWKTAGDAKMFLYALFLAIDANFRLKRKDVSSEEKDPGLGPGWAFFCEVKAYMEHVKQHWDQPQDRSTCVAHDAVDKPDREARGTASSGIGAVDCARHNMKRPQAVGDLQLGERYINMDYIFFRSVQGSDLIRYFVSYDIACQWHVNLWQRMVRYKQEMWLVGDEKFVSFLVPKFHLPAHIEACNLRFSFNLTRDVGQTDGEAPERGWANANPLANSTKEMGPGSRRDTLDDHFNDLNHKKTIQLGSAMLKKTENGIPEMVETRTALEDMEEMLGGVESATVKAWTVMAEAWERDPDSQNPFESVKKNEHLAQVRRELAEEAAAREAAKTDVPGAVRDDMHVTELLAMGLQLEEQQRVLGWDTASTGLHPTDNQRTALVERTSKLRRKIMSWMEIQVQFFPQVSKLRDLEDAARARTSRTQPIQGVRVQDLALWLPSAIQRQPSETCAPDVLEYEYRMRVGQAHEALHEIRQRLLVRTKLYFLKDDRSRGVAANTRAQEKIDAINDNLRRLASGYRAARAALVVLGAALKRNDWEWTLKELREEDVRGLPRATFADPDRQRGAKNAKKVKAGKKRRTKKARLEAKAARAVSWIWIAEVQVVKEGESPEMNEALRIEWAKARARCMRWREEVDLLEEEMRRIVQFLVWRSEWWQEQVGRKGLEDGAQLEGETAYALRQSTFQASLAASFMGKWEHLPALIKAGRTTAVDAAVGGTVTAAASGLAAAAAEDSGEEESGDEEEEEGSGGEEDEHIGALPIRPVRSAYTDS